MALAVAVISILSAVTVRIVNPEKQQERASDATVKALLNKANLSAEGFVSSYSRHPNEEEFFRSLLLDKLTQKGGNNCNVEESPDNECLFSVTGIKLPNKCDESNWKGFEGDTEPCFFRFKGNIQGEHNRYRIYVMSWGVRDTIFVTDNKERPGIHHCPLTITDDDDLEVVCDGGNGGNGSGEGSGGPGGSGGGDVDEDGTDDVLESDLIITTESTPPGNLNEFYKALFYADGGVTPYSWSLLTGTLPPMTFLITEDNVGVVQGTPNAYGEYNFKLGVLDAEGNSYENDFSVTINLKDLEITTADLTGGTQGESYYEVVEATGGQTPYSWEIYTGELHSGLSIRETGSSMEIFGTPIESGSKSFTVRIEDVVGRTASKEYTLNIEAVEYPNSSPVTKRILLLIYDPRMFLGIPLVEDRGWFDYDELTTQIIRNFRESTGGYLNLEIAERVVVRDWPVKTDGFKYTRRSYNRCVDSGGSRCHSPDSADYLAMIEEVDACTKLNNGEIDELWIWGGPWFGFHSARLAGPGAYWVNSPPLLGTTCEDVLPIMGFNYERGLDMASVNFGFRIDSTMRFVFGSWEREETHAWNKFSMLDSDLRGRGGCGNSVYTVNSPSAWIFDSRNTVRSRCDEFFNYPEVGDEFKQVNCIEWGCDIPSYYRWWWRHIPRKEGTNYDEHAGREIMNNWWKYIFDFDWR